MARYEPDAWLTPANALTLLRLAITPVMIGYLVERRFDWPTFGLWFVLCASDGVDGWLARRQGATRSGAFLDPLADKVLVLGALVALAVLGVFWWGWVLVITARELAMSAYRSVVARRGVSVPARRLAKAKTVAQQLAVAFAIMPWVGEHRPQVARWVLVAAVVLTVVSGLQYALDARRRAVRPVAQVS